MARTTKSEQPRRRRWASITQTADHLSKSERTVREMIYDGRLKGYRLGRNMRGIINTLHELTERGVTVRSLHDGVDTSTMASSTSLRSMNTVRPSR